MYTMLKNLFVIALFLFLAGCSIPLEDRAVLRKQVTGYADETIAAMVLESPDLKSMLDKSIGYFAGRVSGAKIPVAGAGHGLGVLYDREKKTRTYMNIQRLELGVGLGKGTFRVLTLFQDRPSLKSFREKPWKMGLAADAAFKGEMKPGELYKVGKGERVYIMSEEGAILTAGARLVRVYVNEDLTDVGVSEFGIPNINFESGDKQGEDAPRVWKHKLPFTAQKVVDLGYDLPLPYGIGLTYVNISQDLLLGQLEVGINGREEEPFEFVSFENGRADSISGQFKVDVWVLPFMNVFGLLGKVDGDAPVDVQLDGNGMLDHLDITCGGPGPSNPLCNVLEDKEFTLPITAGFSGNTYGVGSVLAGGWSDWFVAVPFSFTYADMDNTDTEGVSTTVTPRAGRVLNLGRWGNLALFGGANYLDTELTIAGTVGVDGFMIDYTVEQENPDKWNLVVGYNWDISSRWSWSAEYNGFIGTRDAFISSVVFRY